MVGPRDVDVRDRVARGGSTVVLSGWHDLLVPALAARLLQDGHRVVVPAPPLLPGLTALRTWPGATAGTAGAADGPATRAPTGDPPPVPEFVEHEPDDPDVPPGLAHGVDLVLHVESGPVGADLRGRSSAALDALFALRVAESNGARLVLTSSGAQDQPGPVEGLVAGFRSAHAVDAVLVRVPECYGPGMTLDGPGVVARMIAQASATGTVVVDRRDRRRHRPCYVDDVVAGVLRLAADGGAPDGSPARLGPVVGLSTAEVAEQVCRATGATVRVVGLGALDDPLALEGGEVAPVDGGSSGVGLAEGLRRCLAAADPPVQVTPLTPVTPGTPGTPGTPPGQVLGSRAG